MPERHWAGCTEIRALPSGHAQMLAPAPGLEAYSAMLALPLGTRCHHKADATETESVPAMYVKQGHQ